MNEQECVMCGRGPVSLAEALHDVMYPGCEGGDNPKCGEGYRWWEFKAEMFTASDWLAADRARIAAEAWDEGFDARRSNPGPNPYRAKSGGQS